MIVHNMRFLLLNDQLKDLCEADWSLDRMTGALQKTEQPQDYQNHDDSPQHKISPFE
jgi:hypothetical protein